jgi:hypothetical protein
MNTYKLTLNHDNGKTKVKVKAETLDKAIIMVCEAEGCPVCAVTPNIRTIDKIIDKVDCRRGAPMGRPGVYPEYIYKFKIDQNTKVKSLINFETKAEKRVFDCAVPMSNCGAYDKGGAYWGKGRQLRVSYTKDLSYIEFYRA